MTGGLLAAELSDGLIFRVTLCALDQDACPDGECGE